jgi:hypothetical protein
MSKRYRVQALALVVLGLFAAGVRADYIVTGTATNLGNGQTRYDYTVTDTENKGVGAFQLTGSFHDDFSSVEQPGSYNFFSGQGLADWYRDVYGIGSDCGMKYSFSFVSSQSPGTVNYEVINRSGDNQSGTVVGPSGSSGVPEPGSLVLFGLGGAGMVGSHLWQLWKQK